jgi:hypothetical protein
MTQAECPQTIKNNRVKTITTKADNLAGTLENWFKCREERIQAQFRLLHSCHSEEEINRIKALGLLDFEGTSLRAY